MRVALARWGRAPTNTHRIIAPCHRFRRAGKNSIYSGHRLTTGSPLLATAVRYHFTVWLDLANPGLAGRTMYRCCRGYGEHKLSTSAPPHIHPHEIS